MIRPSWERLCSKDKSRLVKELNDRIGKDVESLSYEVDIDGNIRNIDAKFYKLDIHQFLNF